MEELLTLEEVASLLKVNPRTIHRYVNQKLLPCIRLNQKTIRFKRTDVEKFLERYYQPDHVEQTTKEILSKLLRS